MVIIALPIIGVALAGLAGFVGLFKDTAVDGANFVIRIVIFLFEAFISFAQWLSNNFKSDNLQQIVMGMVVVAFIIIIMVVTFGL